MASERRKLPAKLSPLTGAAVLFLLLLTLATARNGDPRLYPPPPGRQAGQVVSVYLVDNGFHTDLAVPVSALVGRRSGRAAASVAGGRSWVLVGYGDRSFYIAQGPALARAADGLRSLFMPGNPAVLRFDGLAASPDKVWGDGVTSIKLSPRGLAALAEAIDASLEPGPGGGPVSVPDAVGAGNGAPSRGFFAAGRPFSLVHLCNHWTADMLHAAGLPETPVLDTVPAGLKLDLKLRAGVG